MTTCGSRTPFAARVSVSGAEVALYYSFRGISEDSEQNTELERLEFFSFPLGIDGD
jgi:hypothetical protein